MIRIAPEDWQGYFGRGRAEALARGDRVAAGRMMHEGLKRGDRQHLLALAWLFFVRFGAAEDREAILGLPLGAFVSDTMGYYASKADAWRLQGDSARARAYYDSLRIFTAERVRRQPQDDLVHAVLGYAYARLGRAADAVREGRRATELLPISRDAYDGAEEALNLAVIYAVIGDRKAAIDQLRALLEIPAWISPAWLRVSSDWDRIRDDPGFQQLVTQSIPSDSQ
jgi:tetratricopeptide (TPR) repeat protein